MSPPAGKSLQEIHAPQSICFGCGPANEHGLKIRSFAEGDRVVATFQPAPFHQAFEGILNGGIIGALLDCHCNWTAAYFLMKRDGGEAPPGMVTAEYAISLLAPTPADRPVELSAKAISATDRKVVVEGTLSSGDKVCATCKGTFVAVKPGHPAYRRWK